MRNNLDQLPSTSQTATKSLRPWLEKSKQTRYLCSPISYQSIRLTRKFFSLWSIIMNLLAIVRVRAIYFKQILSLSRYLAAALVNTFLSKYLFQFLDIMIIFKRFISRVTPDSRIIESPKSWTKTKTPKILQTRYVLCFFLYVLTHS